jgi:hypothetical protein
LLGLFLIVWGMGICLEYVIGNNFNMVGVSRWGFLPTTYKLTPHIKGEKNTQKKKQNPALANFQLKTKEMRKKEES